MERLDLKNLRRVKKVAENYARVFAGKEWNEVSRCSKYDKFYGPENPAGTMCPCGCGKLEEAYPRVKTTKYILTENSQPESIAIVEKIDGEPIGFGWGFRLSGEKFAEKKYEEKSRKTIKSIVDPTKDYFYISEVGVVPEAQKNKLGGKITRELAEEGGKIGLTLLLRTIKSSTMVYTARNMGMENIMGDENMPQDPENPDRLLFIKRK